MEQKEQLTIHINALLWGITVAIDTTVHSLICSVNVGYCESVSIDHVFGEGCVQEISDHICSWWTRPSVQWHGLSIASYVHWWRWLNISLQESCMNWRQLQWSMDDWSVYIILLYTQVNWDKPKIILITFNTTYNQPQTYSTPRWPIASDLRTMQRYMGRATMASSTPLCLVWLLHCILITGSTN